MEQERQPEGSHPLSGARGTPSCAQSQAHPSHPCNFFVRAPCGTAPFLSLQQVSQASTACWVEEGQLGSFGTAPAPAACTALAHGPGGSTLCLPGASSALAASTQGLHPSTARHGQGTAGIPHSWILICPGHMALAPPGPMGMTKTDVPGTALSQIGPTGPCLLPAWQWEGKTLPWGATALPGDPGAHAANVHCLGKPVAGLDQGSGSGCVPQRCCAAGVSSLLPGTTVRE